MRDGSQFGRSYVTLAPTITRSARAGPVRRGVSTWIDADAARLVVNAPHIATRRRKSMAPALGASQRPPNSGSNPPPNG
ncbi:MAG: hypothetical protein KIT09_36075, partial [Bryobacteraceae bacterium]|nr:hypothetical protein [Bryobacteraceae bacterium]